jgi:hypothetical protein
MLLISFQLLLSDILDKYCNYNQSDTPNWDKGDCDNHHKKAHVVTPVEDELLKALKKEPISIATQLNKNEVGKWHVLLDIMKLYKTAGIQVSDRECYCKYVYITYTCISDF